MDLKTGWKTSEAWLTGIMAWLMHDVMEGSDDWRVQSSAALAAAICAAFYIWSRAKAKGTPDAV